MLLLPEANYYRSHLKRHLKGWRSKVAPATTAYNLNASRLSAFYGRSALVVGLECSDLRATILWQPPRWPWGFAILLDVTNGVYQQSVYITHGIKPNLPCSLISSHARPELLEVTPELRIYKFIRLFRACYQAHKLHRIDYVFGLANESAVEALARDTAQLMLDFTSRRRSGNSRPRFWSYPYYLHLDGRYCENPWYYTPKIVHRYY